MLESAVDRPLPVVDLFAGPGGLGEGFAAANSASGAPAFRICLSIERDAYAHATLTLRSFFRQFRDGRVPHEYYRLLRSPELGFPYLGGLFPEQAHRAREEAIRATLGEEPRERIDQLIGRALAGSGKEAWVLVGGPPCQAYSVIGRSRNRGVKGYAPEKDHRHFLYREYLRILATHWPPVFVMENVPGLLSATVRDSRLFERILSDLSAPGKVIGGCDGPEYVVWSIAKSTAFGHVGHDPRDFIVRSDEYGVPQARHRVVMLGVREDIGRVTPRCLWPQPPCTTAQVIGELPALRGGLSRTEDSATAWAAHLRGALNEPWAVQLGASANAAVLALMKSTLSCLKPPFADRGAEFVPCEAQNGGPLRAWGHDPHLGGVCNHTTREHLPSDLYRYLYASCFAAVHGRSPQVTEFPAGLLPAHRNIEKALAGERVFADRFRVQEPDRPSTTITSHLSKDGHHFIHYDPAQCRSLTVREAARLQTFPDNYLFCGPRTAQYVQVGNAVPPLLARQIAEVVLDLLCRAGFGE